MQIDAESVRNARQQRGWTQEVLAELAGLSLRTIQRIENQGVASNESLNSLCAVLHVPRDQLLISPEQSKSLARTRVLQIVMVAAAALMGAVAGALLTLALT
jgi:transcriptional regulator with XRE-family HTH domain